MAYSDTRDTPLFAVHGLLGIKVHLYNQSKASPIPRIFCLSVSPTVNHFFLLSHICSVSFAFFQTFSQSPPPPNMGFCCCSTFASFWLKREAIISLLCPQETAFHFHPFFILDPEKAWIQIQNVGTVNKFDHIYPHVEADYLWRI